MTGVEGASGVAACELPHPRVIAIDNKRTELENIRDGLLQAGVPCVPLLYDSFEGLQKPIGLKTEHVRYIFLDLNLKDVDEHDPPSLVDPIYDTLKSLDILGAYAIIFWTSYPKAVAKVMELLSERCKDVCLPFFFDTMNKNTLSIPKNPEDDEKDYVEQKELYDKKLAELISVLSAKLSSNDMFSALLAWENKVSEAASKSVRALHDSVRKTQPSGIAQNEMDFCRLLKKLATVAWGSESAKENWGQSIASGLSPFLSDNLDYGMATDDRYGLIWKKALEKNVAARLPKDVCPHVLNTSCTIDTTCKSKDAYGVWLDFKLTISPEFISTFGDSGSTLIQEFLNISEAKKADVDYVNEVKLGILDITRACDYANRKHGLRRFVLGAIIPDSLEKYILWPKKESPEKKHDGIYRLPHISINVGGKEQQESILQVSFKYVLSLPENSPLLTDLSITPLFRVRRQVLADIISKFGAHTTSPGLLSFKNEN